MLQPVGELMVLGAEVLDVGGSSASLVSTGELLELRGSGGECRSFHLLLADGGIEPMSLLLLGVPRPWRLVVVLQKGLPGRENNLPSLVRVAVRRLGFGSCPLQESLR